MTVSARYVGDCVLWARQQRHDPDQAPTAGSGSATESGPNDPDLTLLTPRSTRNNAVNVSARRRAQSIYVGVDHRARTGEDYSGTYISGEARWLVHAGDHVGQQAGSTPAPGLVQGPRRADLGTPEPECPAVHSGATPGRRPNTRICLHAEQPESDADPG